MNFSNSAFNIDYSLERDGNTATVCGTLCNLLEREVSTVLMSFHFYDANDIRVSQEQVFVNEVVPQEKVRFAGSIVIGAQAVESVRLVKAEPIPLSDYPEVSSAGTVVD